MECVAIAMVGDVPVAYLEIEKVGARARSAREIFRPRPL